MAVAARAKEIFTNGRKDLKEWRSLLLMMDILGYYRLQDILRIRSRSINISERTDKSALINCI